MTIINEINLFLYLTFGLLLLCHILLMLIPCRYIPLLILWLTNGDRQGDKVSSIELVYYFGGWIILIFWTMVTF